MFYVIQRHQGDTVKHYIAYSVPRYISSKNSQNIIFEFQQNGVVKRKWAPKGDIILLTSDQALFRATLERLETIKKAHLEKIDAAQAQLDHEIMDLMKTMQSQFEQIQENCPEE